MITHVPARYRYAILGLFLVAFGVVLYGAQEAIKSNTNDARDWLPLHFEETQRLIEFGRHFGSEESLMVSWPDCELGDPRLALLTRELLTAAPTNGDLPYFKSVITGDEAVQRMMEFPLQLTRDKAIQRLKGLLIGTDGQTTAVAMTVAHPETVDRQELVEHVYDCIGRVPGLSRDRVYVAGTTVDGVAINEASEARLLLITVCSYAACFVLMYMVLRCLSTAIMVFVIAVFNQLLTLAVVYFTGWHMDSVLMMAPSLVFVLSISGGVHFTNYYGDAVREGGLPGATWRAVRHGWFPCLLSAVSTSLGVVSLLWSYLVPIQKFGLYASIMVLVAAGILFLMLVCLLEQWPARRWADRLRRGAASAPGVDWFWGTLASAMTRAYVPILLLAVAGTALGCWGVTKARSTARLHDMFAPEARIIRDYEWLERHIGPLVPIEVVVKLPRAPANPESYQTPIVDRLRLLRKVEAAMRSVEGIDAVISPLTFAPPLPTGSTSGMRVAQRVRLTALDRQLAEGLDGFVSLGYLSAVTRRGEPTSLANRLAGGQHWWRVTGRVSASRRLDYQEVLANVEGQVNAVLATAKTDFPQATAAFSGAIPLVEKTQNQMLKDLIASFRSAFLQIVASLILMMVGWAAPELIQAQSVTQAALIVLRATAAGALTMLPNIFPCVVVFGTMGLLGINVELGTVMTASVAIGIAVDDTVHYITWFRRGVAEGRSRREAVEFASRACGTAMVQTALIVGLGLLVYALSEFGPVVRFAWLMFTTLMVALLADLMVTPALLYSPLGRLFLPRPAAQSQPIKAATSCAMP